MKTCDLVLASSVLNAEPCNILEYSYGTSGASSFTLE